MTDAPSGPGEVIHLVGPDVQVGTRRRQRCSWCGAVLEDVDLANIAVAPNPDGTTDGLPAWPVGALISVDGGFRRILPEPEGEGPHPIPPASCMSLDPDLTGA